MPAERFHQHRQSRRFGELRSQVGELVLQLFHTSFKRLRHAANVGQGSAVCHDKTSRSQDRAWFKAF
jgi:hypothetical protein